MGLSLIGLEKWSEAEDVLEKSIEILIESDLQGQLKYSWECLARLYQAQGLLNQALKQVNLILDYLEVSGIDEGENRIVMFPLYICCQVLQAANGPRYPEVLETAHNHLKNLAEKINNEDLRSSFLNNVPWNREILEMWEAEQEKKKDSQP